MITHEEYLKAYNLINAYKDQICEEVNNQRFIPKGEYIPVKSEALINSVELPITTINCLMNQGIKTVGDLYKIWDYRYRNLLKFRGIGLRKALELDDYLKLHIIL
jgi:DNA-directed RNA polymerase alpha subunit